MIAIGWKYATAALTGSFVKVPLEFKAKNLKLKVSNTMTFSFNGEHDHGKIVAADGLVNFEDVNKSDIWVKGTGTYEVTAWDGN